MSTGYQALADLLRERIASGEYAPGGTLPTQADLAQTHGVNIKTVRLAIAQLEADGLVTPIRRRGTVVRERPRMRRLGIERYARRNWKFGLVAFAADREVSGRPWTPGDQTQTVRLVRADAEVAEALDINPGDAVYERARVIRDGDVPTHTLTSWYRKDDVHETPLVDPSPGPAGPGGGFQVLTLQGLEPRRITESLHAAVPTKDERELLALRAGDLVVHLRRITHADNGRPVEFAHGVHNAAHFTWTYSFDVPD